MGFTVKTPKVSPGSSATVPTATPATATETVQEDVTRDYEQRRSNKRGLLSTILSNHNRTGAISAQNGGNTTLG